MVPIRKKYVLDMAEKGLRADERRPDEYRNIKIETGVVSTAEGSARVNLGGSQVIAGVKMSVGAPFADRPEEGVLIVNAELGPMASPEFEAGPPREDAIELARVVDRGIRESKMMDAAKLCITPGEKVWMVNVDIHVLDHDGNLIDAAALASTAALLTAKMPKYENEKINYDERSEPLPVTCKPVAVTTAKVNGRLFADPSLEEENVMAARLTITTKDDNNICAMQKGGTQGFSTEEIEKITDSAVEKAGELRKLLK